MKKLVSIILAVYLIYIPDGSIVMETLNPFETEIEYEYVDEDLIDMAVKYDSINWWE